MNEREFYDYIMENFTLDGTSARLISNIIEYVKGEDFTDVDDAHTHLKLLLDGSFGIEEREIKLYRAPTCEFCGECAPYPYEINDTILCGDCSAAYELSEDDDDDWAFVRNRATKQE